MKQCIWNIFRNAFNLTSDLRFFRNCLSDYIISIPILVRLKDMYSFHSDLDDCSRFYDEVRTAYRLLFREIGLSRLLVEVAAPSGAMGGLLSHEFHLLAEVGEDTLYKCPVSELSIMISAVAGILLKSQFPFQCNSCRDTEEFRYFVRQ